MKNELVSNPKSFYGFIKSKRRSNDCPKSLHFGSDVADDDTGISNIFASFFKTTYSDNVYDSTFQYPYYIEEFSTVTIPLLDITTVLANLKSLKDTTVPGPDGIPSCILKYCAENFALPLSIMFNKSLDTGYLPPIWKESFIVPLFKSGSRIDASNYRGIAKLNTIPKLFEKIVTEILSFQVSSVFCKFQHGFRKHRSTVTNLLELTTIVNEGFRRRYQTDCIYTDFSKAFDKVNHELLLLKLHLMGFSNALLKWIRSYLMGRAQMVKVGNAISDKIIVTSGVPQGSHLGPVLFTLFINDLPSVIHRSKVLMYADDVKIFYSFNEEANQCILQSDLNEFYKWCNANLLELNTLKCKHMSFFRLRRIDTSYYLNDCMVEYVDSIHDLGILLDHRLDFRKHISLITNKAYRSLGFIKRWSKEFSDPLVTKQLYISFVRSTLEYGSIIWDPAYSIHSNAIESVQKQFLLFCLKGRGWDPRALPSYEYRLNLIKLPTLKSRRIMLNVTFLINIMQGKIISDFILNRIYINVPLRPSRNYQLFQINYFTSNYANNDPLRRLFVEFNKFYSLIDLSEKRDSVKRKLILHLNT